MSVIVGTTISGTYADGVGLPTQSHLIFAANAGVWWLFTTTSASDTAGNPGTHTIKSYYSSGPDLTTATWTASTDSPNFAGSGANTAAKLEGGRALGCLYWNNSAGSNKDIVLCTVAMQNPNKLAGGNSYNGIIRAVVTANTITWDAWGGHTETNWNNPANHTFQAGNILGRTADGYIQIAGMYLHSEVDAAALTSLDPDTSDTWTTGNTSASGNNGANATTCTALSNQTRMKAGMAFSYEAGDYGPTSRYPKINSLDSGTQITLSQQMDTASTGGERRWWQFSPGTNRTTNDCPMLDTGMTNECQCYAFAPLASNGMLCVYDTGAGTPPNFSDLSSRKANQTQGQGFWPATSAAGNAVFGSAVTNDIQDWCCVPVDNTHIYALRRTAATTIAMRVYSTGGDSWSAGTAPPTLTGKTIKAGGGLMGVTDGIDMWIFVIDSTDNAIKYCKYTVAAGTWGSWTTLETVSSTATKMSGYPKIGGTKFGLSFMETNGGNFDTRVTTLELAPPGVIPDSDSSDFSIQQRMG